MGLLKNISFGLKLPVLFVSLMAGSLLIAGGIAFSVSSTKLVNAIDQQLGLVADGRATSIAAWVEGVKSDVQVATTDSATANAMADFNETFAQIPGSAMTHLQKAYIADSPFDTGEKHFLDMASDGSDYSFFHEQYHNRFRSLLLERGYYDIFLINLDGDIVYSVYKELDFATNLKTGEFATSGLADAFRGAALIENATGFAFSDFRPYAPSHGAPAAFVAKPVFDSMGQKQGVMAFQLPIDRMQSIMADRAALTPTVEIMVVADDLTTRSNRVLGDVTELGSQVDRNPAIDGALKDQAGLQQITIGNGTKYRVAYRPVDFFGTTYAMLAAEPQKVVAAGSMDVFKSMVLGIVAVLVVGSTLSFFVARNIVHLIRQMSKAMERVANYDFDTHVPHIDRGDEIGIIANTLKGLRYDLKTYDDASRENLYKSAAFAGTSAAMMITDSDFNITFANQTVLDLLVSQADLFAKHVPAGFDPKNVVGKNIDTFHVVPANARKILTNPRNLPYEADISLGDKRFSILVSPVYDQKERSIGFVVEWKDVSQERINTAVLDAINTYQCTAQILGDGEIIEVNEAFAKVVGTDASDLAGTACEHMFLFNPQLAQEYGAVWDRLEQGESVYGKFKVACADGSHGTLEGGFSPVRDKRGNLVRVAFMGADRTDSEAQMAEAQAKREEMEKAQALVVDQLRIGLDRVAEGDLTATIDTPFNDDYEQLRINFNRSILSLLKAMQSVAEGANSMTGDVKGISDATHNLSRRTEQQAATLEETAAALDELTASVQQAATGAGEADRIVIEARENAKDSGEIVNETVGAMGKIDESSKQISKIIGVIDEIAFQTNLLALNAGVEAARAGEAGRGFAVVASEVRALAQRSSEAAHEIGQLISESTTHVQHGVKLVDRTGVALEQIVASVSTISEHVSQIAQSAQEQSIGIQEINSAVNQLDQATQQNAAMHEETNAAGSALSREAANLSAHVDRFNLGTGMASTDEDTTVQHAGERIAS